MKIWLFDLPTTITFFSIVNTLSLQKCSGCFRHLSSQCLSCHCCYTNEQLWSRAGMLLPSAMFCNNSQCEVDNCIKSSINRGGDEIYSTEEQEIQVPTHWSAEVPQVNWWRSGVALRHLYYTIVVVVYLPLTPKIIDQLNEVVIKHASYFFSKVEHGWGPSWEIFFSVWQFDEKN